MGEDSCPRSCKLESQHRILDVLFHIDLIDIVLWWGFLKKKPKIPKKRPAMAHFKKATRNVVYRSGNGDSRICDRLTELQKKDDWTGIRRGDRDEEVVQGFISRRRWCLLTDLDGAWGATLTYRQYLVQYVYGMARPVHFRPKICLSNTPLRYVGSRPQ